MLRQHNRHVSDKRHVSHHAANNVLAHQVILSRGVEFCIVGIVVVALCQEFRIVPNTPLVKKTQIDLWNYSPIAKLAHNSVHNGNVLVLDIVDHHLSNVRLPQKVSVPEEEQVATLKGRFHGSGEYDDDRGRRVADDRETFPHLPRETSASRSGQMRCARGGGNSP